MKLRLIELTNVRRFGDQTARLGPFGDGLTTITDENEAGKSTFFDALHAVFFTAHGSKSAEVKALQPYSGGAVEIAVEIDIEDRPYRIEKTYLSAPSAKVIDAATGQVIKQQGDAEAWIETHVNSTRKGPAGLLWVRQGDAHVDPEGRGKDADNIAARRDLMSSVRGQIDAVTGGRRMDKIAERCRKEFDDLSTQNIKPKAGSAWKQVEDRIAGLVDEQDKLSADVAKLTQALKIKTRTATRLRSLQDPEKQADRAAQIATAATALEQAKQHAENVAKADQAVQLIDAEIEKYTRDIKDINDARAARERLSQTLAQTRADVERAAADRASAEQSLTRIKAEITAMETTRRTLQDSLTQARTAQRRSEKWRDLHRIAGLIQQLAKPQQRLSEAQTVLSGPDITAADLDRMTQISQRISVAKEQRRAHFASMTITPDDPATATLNGAPITPDAPVLIDRPLHMDIDGFGSIHLHPAQGAGLDIEDPATLEASLTASLAEHGFETLASARAALSTRENAQNDARVAQAEIRGLAPDGAAALTDRYAALCAELDHPNGAPLPDPDNAQEQDADQFETRIATLQADLDALHPQTTARQQTLTDAITAEATATGALTHLIGQQQTNPPPKDEDAQLAQHQTRHQNATARADEARATLAQLRGAGPDLTTAQSTFDRLHSADQADRAEIETLRRELARADGAIEAQSEGAVEENLAAVTDALEKARSRSARFEMQARALRLLIDHLDGARKDAQETYFEPIRQELHPLLAQLHAGAAFELDPDKMLVDRITRNGVTDDIAVLSGGAYEQVAILTRLAFAKLFARQGLHVPVILDDALVHTDDERISLMFNMLSQAGKDQQIIVLSCRTRAFSDLGGTRAHIEIVT